MGNHNSYSNAAGMGKTDGLYGGLLEFRRRIDFRRFLAKTDVITPGTTFREGTQAVRQLNSSWSRTGCRALWGKLWVDSIPNEVIWYQSLGT